MKGWDDMVDSVELATKFSNVVEEIKEIKLKLSEEQSILDQKVLDIQHYIESRNLNAVEGYKAYKLLQETLKERRLVKNRASEIEPIYSALINTKLNNKATEIQKKVVEIHNRNNKSGYNVRVMKDVFGKRIERSL